MFNRSPVFATPPAIRPTLPSRATLLLPCLLSLAVGSAWAEGNSAAEATLNTVVVTASGTAIDIKDAPASISVITREEIERQPVYD